MVKRSCRVASLLWVVLAALLIAMPASAHMGEVDEGGAAPASQSATPSTASPKAATEADQDMSGMDMSQMEMTWPTGDDGGMMMGGGHRERPTTIGGRMIAWLGAWHPAVIHFPIALLLTVAFLELAALATRKPVYTASSKILLAVAVVGAFVAAPLGWASAGLPTPTDNWALTTHRWMGTAVPFLLLLLWYLKQPVDTAAKRPSSSIYEIVLAISVLVILAQAYLGGEITHGANHMAF